MMCAKHRAEYDKWSDWGPHNPKPKSISMETISSQLRLIKEAHANGQGCSDATTEAFGPACKCGAKAHRDDAMNLRCNSCERLVRLCDC